MTLGIKYFTDKTETFKHFILKMLLYRMLREAGREVYVEFDMGRCGIADVYDYTLGYVYEFESSPKKNTFAEGTFKQKNSVKRRNEKNGRNEKNLYYNM